MVNSERVSIHPNLKNVLIKLSNMINEEAIKETGYPIPKGLPVASKIAASILEKILVNKEFINIEKVDKKLIFDTKIDSKIKEPIFFLMFDFNDKGDRFGFNREFETLKNNKNISLVEKRYLNLELFKKRGIKENAIQFI
jgi:hypothetical protein